MGILSRLLSLRKFQGDPAWVPQVGEECHILIDGSRNHIGITVTHVEKLENGMVRLWSAEYGDVLFDVDEAMMLRIGKRYRGRFSVSGS